MSNVNLIISIDTECDKGPGWLIQEPLSFQNITQGVPEILTPLFEEYQLKPTYLLSPEILHSDICMDTFSSLKNVEFGTHLHGEFIEPKADFKANRTKTPQLAYSVDVEREKLQNLTALFYKKLNYHPRSFRAGRWGMSKHTLKILENLNYKVDSSVCSFRTHQFGNEQVNFWGAPLQDYHPSSMDFRRKGNMKIIERPATLGNSSLIYWPRFILRRLNDNSKIHKKVLGKLGRTAKVNWLRPYKSTSKEMIALSEAYIRRFSNNSSVTLNMMFHSNEILPGTSPYVKNEQEQLDYLNSLRELFAYLKSNYNLLGIGLSDIEETN